MAARMQVDLSAFPSDGSALNWPSGNRYTIGSERDETRWLDKISGAKNTDRAPASISQLTACAGDPLVTYIELPRGYRVFAQARNNNTNRARNYLLYGHPNGHFDSAPKAYVHIRHIWLRNLANCTCTKCNVRVPAAGRKPFWQLRL
ncbi:hypothetical protein KCU77_g7492, partial [Aureobasidium melanogenum]